MTGPGRRFDAAELRSSEDGISEADLTEATTMGRELEALARTAGIEPSPGFADRVMTAVAAEAPPRLVVRPARNRIAAFGVALGEAWRVATSPGRPMAVRGQALAFVLLVVLAAGSVTSVAAIGVANLLSTPPGPTPNVVPLVTDGPTTIPSPLLPAPSPSPDALPTPTDALPSGTDESGETDEAGETDQPNGGSGEPTDTAKPTKTPRPTDRPRPTKTPKPTKTPEAEETPDDDETPEPDETPDDDDDEADDDHGGPGPG